MKAELVPTNGDAPIPITKDVTIVGRGHYCDVRVDHPSLSKRHCVLVKTDGLLVVRDLASTNGTKVKGQKIRWAALLPHDRIAFGTYKFRVYLGPDDAPGPSELARWSNDEVRPSAHVAGAATGGTPNKPESPAAVVPMQTETDEPAGDDPDLDCVVGLEDLVIDLD
jgi:pSer/pThr/pTyr-binding forkhead associated (FHA) protein